MSKLIKCTLCSLFTVKLLYVQFIVYYTSVKVLQKKVKPSSPQLISVRLEFLLHNSTLQDFVTRLNIRPSRWRLSAPNQMLRGW